MLRVVYSREFLGATLPAWGRFAYVGRVASLSGTAASLEEALAVSQERNLIKMYFRGPIASWFSDYKAEAQVLAKYGKDTQAIMDAAGRSNPYFNTLAGTQIYAQSLKAGANASNCTCGN